MGVKAVSEHIRSVGVWVGLPIHVWIVAEQGGVTLVDTGLKWMAGSILKEIERMEAGPLKRIVLTHGHSDHVGSLQTLLARYPVPVYMHEREIAYAEGDLAYPGKSRPFAHVQKGLLQPLTAAGKNGLDPIGSLQPFFTPGHSPGHVVYFHAQDQVLLAGDLFHAKRGRLLPARFSPDPALALRSGNVLRTLDPERLEVCHGGTVYRPAGQLGDLEQEAERAETAAKARQARIEAKKSKRSRQ